MITTQEQPNLRDTNAISAEGEKVDGEVHFEIVDTVGIKFNKELRQKLPVEYFVAYQKFCLITQGHLQLDLTREEQELARDVHLAVARQMFAVVLDVSGKKGVGAVDQELREQAELLYLGAAISPWRVDKGCEETANESTRSDADVSPTEE